MSATEATCRLQPAAIRMGLMSEIGLRGKVSQQYLACSLHLPVMMFPPMAATFLICFPANQRSISRICWKTLHRETPL